MRVESILDVELGRGSDYIRVHFDGGSALADRGGGTPAVCNFFRFNRAQLINTVHIAPLEPWFSQTLEAKLRDGKAVEFGRRASLLFRETRGL